MEKVACGALQSSGGSEFQTLQVLAHRVAVSLAARHRRATVHDQDEVTAWRAAHFLHVAHVDETGAADAQHRLRLEGFFRLLQRAARMEGVAADGETDVVAVGLDHLDLGHIQHVHAAPSLGQHPRLHLRAQARGMVELLEQCAERSLTVEAARALMAAPHARHGGLEARIIEGLQQIVDRADLEGFERIVIVGRHEHDERQILRSQRARQRHAGHGIHLDVEEQHVRRLLADRLERGAAVAVLADHPQVRLPLAALAHRTPRCRLIVDDDDVHHERGSTSDRVGGAPGPSRSSGMWISASHRSSSTAPAVKLAASPNCTSRRSRTLAMPMPVSPTALPGAMVLRTRSTRRSPLTYASTRITTGPSCPARPWTTAFSTSGWRIRLGTQARAMSSRTGTRIVRRSAKRFCCSSRYSVTNCSSSERRENSRSPALSSRRSRSPSCTTIACAVAGSQLI